jgi:hypothetical protein
MARHCIPLIYRKRGLAGKQAVSDDKTQHTVDLWGKTHRWYAGRYQTTRHSLPLIYRKRGLAGMQGGIRRQDTAYHLYYREILFAGKQAVSDDKTQLTIVL